MTSISKLINIRRNCNKGEAHACDCVLQVRVRKLSTNWDFSRPAFSTIFLFRFVDGDTLGCLRIGLSTNRDVDESGRRRIGTSTNRAICESTCNRCELLHAAAATASLIRHLVWGVKDYELFSLLLKQ